MEFWDAERIAAIGGAIAAIAGAIWIRGRSKGETQPPSPHQEAVRPETAAEIKSAAAQTSSADSLRHIAESLDRIERNTSLFIDRSTNRRKDHE